MALGAFKISSATMDGVEGKRAFETAIWTCQLLFGRFPFPQEESTVRLAGIQRAATLGTGEGLERIGLRPLRIRNLFSASRAILFNVLFARLGLAFLNSTPLT